jgi:hypothetical protein
MVTHLPFRGKRRTSKKTRRNKAVSDQTTQQQPTQEEIEAVRAMKAQQSSPPPTRLERARGILNSVDPWILVGIGALTLLVWVICTITQVRTSEALMMGGQKVPVDVEWGVFLQPVKLIMGTAPLPFVMPWCYAWVIETLTLIWGLAMEHAKVSVLVANKLMGSVYGTITVLLIGLNGWADYNSAPGNDPLQQGLLAGAVGLMVTTGLTVGLALLKVGLSKMKQQH